eukprot:5683655-Pleurochrysis_carterae.AAC.1
MCLPVARRPRVCLSLRRAERVATRARAFEAMRRSMHALRVTLRSCLHGLDTSTSGGLASHGVARSLGAVFVETGAFASGSSTAACLPESGRELSDAQGRKRLASINAASLCAPHGASRTRKPSIRPRPRTTADGSRARDRRPSRGDPRRVRRSSCAAALCTWRFVRQRCVNRRMEREAWTAWACATRYCTGSALEASATGSSPSIGEGRVVPRASAQWPASVARARVGDEQT